MSDFMGTKEAAEKWGCNQSEVAKWCREGKILNAEKKDGVWQIPKDEKCPEISDTKKTKTGIKNELKRQLLEELKEEVAKSNARIRELEEKIITQRLLKSTVRDTLGANSARKACDKRAQEARERMKIVENEVAWKKEMLSKYK